MSGNNGQVRYGFEAREGVPWHDWFYTPFVSESLVMNRPNEPNPNIDGSGDILRGDQLQATGAGSLNVAPNTENLLAMRAHMHDFYEIAATTDATVKDWVLRKRDPLEDAEVAHYIKSLQFGLWRDQRDLPSENKAFGAKASKMTLTQNQFKHVLMQHDFLFLRDTYSRAVQEDVDAAFTGEVGIVGHRILGDENGDQFKFKITVPGALGVAKGVWGKGDDDDAYGTTAFFTAPKMDVMNADDTLYSPKEEPLQVYFVDVEDSEFTVDDVFYFYATEPDKPVATLSTRPTLASTKLDFEIQVSGNLQPPEPIEQFSITHYVPREGVGQEAKYFQSIDVPNADSRPYWEAQISKTYINRVMEQALIGGALVNLHARFYGGYIGSTKLMDYSDFALSNMWLIEAGSKGVSGPGRLPETITLRGKASDCVETHRNTILSIAPTP